MQKTKKRFLSALLTCAMLVGLFPFAAFAENGNVAKIGEREYTTLQGAINEAASGAEIELIADTTENITVAADDNITLDLNGHKVTNTNTHTIINNGHLVIKDDSSASAATGTVDNITHGKAAIYNYGTLTIQGGMYTRSLETQDCVDDGADNSWYTVVNVGTMTINDGFFTTADGQSENLGNRSSLIRNGDGTRPGNLTISNGKFVSGANVIKNEPGSVIEAITGGNFTMDNSKIAWYAGNNLLQNYGTIKTISGGVFKALGDGLSIDRDTNYYRHGIAVYDNGKIENIGGKASFEMEGSQNRLIRCDDNASIQITGGSYALSAPEKDNNVFCYKPHETATISITGGTFSSDVSSLVPVNYECTKDEVTGKFTVQKMDNKLVVGSTTNDNGNVSATLEGTFVGNSTGTDEGTDVANNAISVDITTNNSTSTEKSELTVNADTAKSLANADELTVESDVATVTLDQTALAKMNNVEKDVVITVEKKASSSSDENVAASYTVTVESDRTNLLPDGQDNGTVTITVPTDDTTVQPWYVVNNIYVEKLNVVSTTGDSITFEIGHLSTIELLKSAPTTGTAVGSITTSSGVTYYSDAASFITAINRASAGSVVNLMADVAADTASKSGNITAILHVTNGIKINGNGYTLSYTGSDVINHIINVTANDTTINDLVINANNAKYGVHFYCTTSGTLNKVNISNAKYACVNVNGAQNVVIKDSTLNAENGFECIEYAMGSGVQKIPSMSISNVSFESTPYVLADKTTTNAMKTLITGNPTNEEILDKILENVAYTNPNGGKLSIVAQFTGTSGTDDTYLTGSVESTYQPPYTGKYSYAINVADMDNGSVSVDKYATEGEKVTLTVSPDKAYKLDELTVTAGGKDVELTDNGDGTYTFTMPSSNVKVSASFVEDKDYVEPDTSITMTIGSNDFVINNNIVTVPDAAPYIANDRAYVPFRALGEALGAKVVWDNDARTVTYTLGDTEIVMTIGDTTYTINGVEKSMDVAPEITGDRTYVPVRFVAEGLGFKVTPLYADNGTTTSVVFEK